MSLCMSLSQRSVCDCNKRILYCIVYSLMNDDDDESLSTKLSTVCNTVSYQDSGHKHLPL